MHVAVTSTRAAGCCRLLYVFRSLPHCPGLSAPSLTRRCEPGQMMPTSRIQEVPLLIALMPPRRWSRGSPSQDGLDARHAVERRGQGIADPVVSATHPPPSPLAELARVLQYSSTRVLVHVCTALQKTRVIVTPNVVQAKGRWRLRVANNRVVVLACLAKLSCLAMHVKL